MSFARCKRGSVSYVNVDGGSHCQDTLFYEFYGYHKNVMRYAVAYVWPICPSVNMLCTCILTTLIASCMLTALIAKCILTALIAICMLTALMATCILTALIAKCILTALIAICMLTALMATHTHSMYTYSAHIYLQRSWPHIYLQYVYL